MWNTSATDNEQYLRQQLEEERARVRQLEERQQDAYERQIEERRLRHAEDERTARSWPDALRKQSRLMWSEYKQFAGYEWSDPEEEDYFAQCSKACDRALEIWTEEEAKVADEIAELQAKIEALHLSVRLNVGKRLNTERPVAEKDGGWLHATATLQDEDADPTAWLNW